MVENVEVGEPQKEHEIETAPAQEPLRRVTPAELPDPVKSPTEVPVPEKV